MTDQQHILDDAKQCEMEVYELTEQVAALVAALEFVRSHHGHSDNMHGHSDCACRACLQAITAIAGAREVLKA